MTQNDGFSIDELAKNIRRDSKKISVSVKPSSNKNLPIKIRHAQIEDASSLALAEQEIARQPGILLSVPSELKTENFEQKISSILTHKNGQYLVVEADNVLIAHGFLETLPLQSICHVATLTLVVHQGWQGKGVGTLLLQKLIEWAKEWEIISKIELSVRASNTRAIALYTKFNFQQEGLLKHHVRIADNQFVDEILMGLQL